MENRSCVEITNLEKSINESFDHSFIDDTLASQQCQTLSENQNNLIATVVGVILQIIIILVIAGGNSVVLYLVIRTKKLRITANAFVVSLAAADGLMSLALVPGVVLTLDPLWITQNTYNCLMLWCAIMFTCCTSAMSLLAITIERFVRIHWSLYYMKIITWSRVRAVIAFIWVSTSICTVLLPFSGLNRLKHNEAFDCFDFTSVFHSSYLVFIMLTFGMTPFVIMCCLYGKIFVTVLGKIKKSRRAQAFRVEPKSLRAEIKSIQILVIILGFTGVAWVPFTVVILMEIYSPYQASFALRGTLSWLTYLNSGVNPILYTLRSNAFRNAWRRHRKPRNRQRTSTGSGTGTSSPATKKIHLPDDKTESTRMTLLRWQSSKVCPDIPTISSHVNQTPVQKDIEMRTRRIFLN